VRNPTASDSYTVVYTGRLFGYYRFPEVEVTQRGKGGIFPLFFFSPLTTAPISGVFF